MTLDDSFDPGFATPVCPHCWHPPFAVFHHQAFCGNEDCDVIIWDPWLTAEENEANAAMIPNPSDAGPGPER